VKILAKRIFNVLIFFAAAMFFSCSGLDETSNLGKKIIENKSQDGMKPGVYKTILLEQSPQTYASVVDTLSGKRIHFVDTLRNYLDTLRSGEKKIVSQWTIGNWENKNEEVMLKLCHYPYLEKKERRISDFLDSLITHNIAEPDFVKAELLWTNTTRNNSFESANVEIGAIFSYPNDTTVFPLNFALVNPKNSSASVPFTIGTYLLDRGEKKDTAYIERYEARYTNFVDTVKTVTFFRKFSDADPDPKENDIDTTIKPERDKITGTIDVAAYKKIYFATDTLISWKDYVPFSLYDTNKTVLKEPSEGFNVLEIFSSKDEKIGTIKHRRDSTKYNKEFPPEDGIFDPSHPPLLYMHYIDTLIITYEDTAIYRFSKSSVKGNWEDNDSIVTHIKYTSAIDPVTLKPRSDTLIQTGYKYQTALTEPQKHSAVRANEVYVVGGNLVNLENLMDNKILRDSLVMYLRVNKESRENIMHISTPFIRLSYRKKGAADTTRIYITIPFTEISVIAKSSDEDELTDDDAVISNALQRFAKIDLNLKDFFNEISKEKFFNIGLAELMLNISPQTDFPGQYGDSIRLNAIILSKEADSATLFTMPANRSVSSAYVKRNSGTVKLNLVETLTDFLYDEYRHIYEDLPEDEENESDGTEEDQTVNPFPKLEEAKSYLYLWLDDLKMGRIYFEPKDLNFTYILQTRKDGNSDKKDDTEEGGEQ
jgi:hypothetical protein